MCGDWFLWLERLERLATDYPREEGIFPFQGQTHHEIQCAGHLQAAVVVKKASAVFKCLAQGSKLQHPRCKTPCMISYCNFTLQPKISCDHFKIDRLEAA